MRIVFPTSPRTIRISGTNGRNASRPISIIDERGRIDSSAAIEALTNNALASTGVQSTNEGIVPITNPSGNTSTARIAREQPVADGRSARDFAQVVDQFVSARDESPQAEATATDENVTGLRERIKEIESSGDYNARAWTGERYGFAKGAYQFIDATWDRAIQDFAPEFSQYIGRGADSAPPEDQDAIASAWFTGLSQRYNGDLRLASVAHFAGEGVADALSRGEATYNGRPIGSMADNLGTTVDSYLSKVEGAAGPVAQANPVQSEPAEDSYFSTPQEVVPTDLRGADGQEIVSWVPGSGLNPRYESLNIDPTTASGFQQIIDQFPNVRLGSSHRDTNLQSQLYDRYLSGQGPLAAPPGSSDHEHGRAVDIVGPPDDLAGVISFAQSIGAKQAILEYDPRTGALSHAHVAFPTGYSAPISSTPAPLTQQRPASRQLTPVERQPLPAPLTQQRPADRQPTSVPLTQQRPAERQVAPTQSAPFTQQRPAERQLTPAQRTPEPVPGLTQAAARFNDQTALTGQPARPVQTPSPAPVFDIDRSSAARVVSALTRPTQNAADVQRNFTPSDASTAAASIRESPPGPVFDLTDRDAQVIAAIITKAASNASTTRTAGGGRKFQ